MAKEKPTFALLRKPATLAQPQGDRVSAADQRVDVLARALEHSSPAAKEAKQQRSREGMVSLSVWVKPEGRKALKAFCIVQKDETMEAFALRAINKLLAEEGADFQLQ